MGLGPIGSMFVRLAKVYGARVIAIGRRQQQLDRAQEMGADEGIIAADGVDINGDLFASADYRRHLAAVYTKRAIEAAVERTK